MSDDIDYDPKYAGCEHPDSYSLVDTLEELEALRAELTEQARVNGKGGQRELKLIAERDEARGEVAALREQLAGARKALIYIRNEAERENGGWVHLKRCIAVQSRAALTALNLQST